MAVSVHLGIHEPGQAIGMAYAPPIGAPFLFLIFSWSCLGFRSGSFCCVSCRFGAVLFRFVLFRFVSFCFVSFRFVLFHFVLFCFRSISL